MVHTTTAAGDTLPPRTGSQGNLAVPCLPYATLTSAPHHYLQLLFLLVMHRSRAPSES